VTRVLPGSLKCIVADGSGEFLEALLPERIRPADIRRMGPSAFLAHTPLEASELRDWLAGHLQEGASLLVVEFETWSGYGDGVDTVWLLERGH